MPASPVDQAISQAAAKQQFIFLLFHQETNAAAAKMRQAANDMFFRLKPGQQFPDVAIIAQGPEQGKMRRKLTDFIQIMRVTAER